jgi:nitroimidazol reductase NimA-like FMN-containing flavoprotein (pyridoxamine 5'-phosphate oxidase superfamily)
MNSFKCKQYVMDHAQRAKKIIESNLYINLATTDGDSNPWNTPVFTAYDELYNFYWASWIENQHSQNIEANSRVFATTYDSTVPEGKGEAVYMRGTAHMLTDELEIQKAIDVSYARKNKTPRTIADFTVPTVRRFYCFTPETVWVNIDDFTLSIDKRLKIEIKL